MDEALDAHKQSKCPVKQARLFFLLHGYAKKGKIVLVDTQNKDK